MGDAHERVLFVCILSMYTTYTHRAQVVLSGVREPAPDRPARVARSSRDASSRRPTAASHTLDMITAVHVLQHSRDPAADRAFMRDVLGWPNVEDVTSEPGWLIFALPPTELGIHPTDAEPLAELHLMCDDITATVSDLQAKGVEIDRAGGRIAGTGWPPASSFRAGRRWAYTSRVICRRSTSEAAARQSVHQLHASPQPRACDRAAPSPRAPAACQEPSMGRPLQASYDRAVAVMATRPPVGALLLRHGEERARLPQHAGDLRNCGRRDGRRAVDRILLPSQP